ncbi:transglutaminase-like cysteine peptidase [Methylobacterium sp. SyP6R]|uniref:transglutaminase-like cysteine peptidase n=1 Tax=Methylobacterium sp. SyP6R TaxID=2718876 RepID=UPI001F257E21|nr:transglutaminase-like cysteine peptidase [Methylobacterium sp. SyP6R]MCF4128946.1 transglutaminase-like cysteine peptidase [Methylobacterium sp. SyP6R]
MTTGFGHQVKRVLVGVAMLSAAFVTGQADEAAAQTLAALPMPSAGAPDLGHARPIVGWVEFCARYASECAVDVSEPAQVTLTPRLWQTVTGINRQVNTSLRAVTDQEHWGVPDRWDLAEDGSGDCEDFQLLKRKLLAQAGLPRRAMRMTVVIDEKGEGHAVLMLRTDRGDLVLDNKTSAVLPWHKTGYTYIKRESQDATAWVSLGGATAPTVTANR